LSSLSTDVLISKSRIQAWIPVFPMSTSGSTGMTVKYIASLKKEGDAL